MARRRQQQLEMSDISTVHSFFAFTSLETHSVAAV